MSERPKRFYAAERGLGPEAEAELPRYSGQIDDANVQFEKIPRRGRDKRPDDIGPNGGNGDLERALIKIRKNPQGLQSKDAGSSEKERLDAIFKANPAFYVFYQEVLGYQKRNEPVPVDLMKEVTKSAMTDGAFDILHSLPMTMKVEMNDGEIVTHAELDERKRQRDARKERESLHEDNAKKLANQFGEARSRTELEAVIRSSKYLERELMGDSGAYSKEDLLVLIDGLWKGEIAIDNVTRACGFREAVARIAEKDRTAARPVKTFEELEPVIRQKMSDEEAVPEEMKTYSKDESGKTVYTYDPKTADARPKRNDWGILRAMLGRFFKKKKAQESK